MGLFQINSLLFFCPPIILPSVLAYGKMLERQFTRHYSFN